MQFGRKIKGKIEEEFWKQAYKIGMGNGWCSGDYARQDGDFICEEDCLNKDSVCTIDDIQTLKAFFKNGNWCLGQAVIYQNLCFIQQDNGGDEWLTMKLFSDGKVRDFESITFGPLASDYAGEDDKRYTGYKEFLKGENFDKYIGRLMKAKVFLKDKERVVYSNWNKEEYKGMKPIAR